MTGRINVLITLRRNYERVLQELEDDYPDRALTRARVMDDAVVWQAALDLALCQRTINRIYREQETNANRTGEEHRGLRTRRPRTTQDFASLSLSEDRLRSGTHHTQRPSNRVRGSGFVSSDTAGCSQGVHR